MITTEEKQQFSEILNEVSNTLDITQEEHDAAVKSYQFVGDWLAQKESPLYPFSPEILPQGSFMLGTMIRPVNENDELDIDLVCRLEGKRPEWTQFHLKKFVGDRLIEHGIIKKLVKIPDGRRCWTLQYSEDAKFHMDVLPSIVSSGYRTILEKAFAATDFTQADSLAIRITDKQELNYRSSTSPEEWLKSNPFGYGIWFEQRATILFKKAVMMSEAVQPVPKYRKEKFPLHRVVQILKRHRDIIFNGDDDKPISIIITTLAAKAYRKEADIITALINVIQQMPNEIEERIVNGKKIKWIQNPVNPHENFADKWVEKPQKQINFYKWMNQVNIDLQNALQQHGRGINKIQEALEKPFGKNSITKAFSNYGDNLRKLREGGGMKMAGGTGIIGTIGRTVISPHTNFGADA